MQILTRINNGKKRGDSVNWKIFAIKESIANNDIAVTDRLTRALLGLDEDIFDGGPGSGNFGHRGRPGQHGGSLPQGESQMVNKEEAKKGFASNAARELVNNELANAKVGYKFNVRRNKGVVTTYEKTEEGWRETRTNEKTGKTYEDRVISAEEMANSLSRKEQSEPEANEKEIENVVERIEPEEEGYEFRNDPENYINLRESGEPDLGSRSYEDPEDRFENEIERIDPEEEGFEFRMDPENYVHLKDEKQEDYALDGGPGSGNFGHSGRPGKVGGSAKGSGGSVFRTGSKESGYSSFVKNELFKGIASHARAAKNDGAFVHAMNKKQQDALMNQWKACGAKESLGTYAERIYNMLHNRKGSDIRQKNKPVNGKDLSETWEYKGPEKKYYETEATKEIDTPIEDILHTQGYDGVPKIVSQAEFDRITKEHPEMPLLYRSYAAPTPEQVKEYDNDLERGFFYVDCGTGGAGFGQGMYCAGVYPHPDENGEDRLKKTLIDGAIEEMKHYRNINIRRIEDSDPHVAPEGKVMVTGGTSEEPLYKYYDPKEFRDFSKPPEDGQLIAYWEKESNIAAEGILRYKDGKIDGTFISWEPAEGDKWAPLEGDCEPVPIDPTATTRVMTLDPSAKIITYNDLQKFRNKSYDIREEAKREREKKEKEFFGDIETAEDLERAFIETKLYHVALGMGTGAELSRETLKKIADYRKSHPERMKEIQELVNWSVKNKEDAEERAKKYARFRSMDPGVLAAVLGYDAINAQGHGQSKSYTVVLNRTKLIISEDEVDVWR